MKKIFTLLCFLPFGISFAQSIQKAPFTVDQIWGSADFYQKYPQQLTPLKDDKHYFTLDVKEMRSAVVEYDAKNGDKLKEIVGSNDINVGFIEDYVLSNDEKQLILVSNSEQIYRHSYLADIHYYNIETKEHFEIAPDQKGKRDFSFSPDGKFIIYSFQNNLYKCDIATQKISAITTDGKDNEVINGTADWVYEEEFSKTKFYDISHDGKYLAYIRFEQNDVPPVVLSYFYGQTYPTYKILKYPKVGQKNSVVSLHIYDLNSKNDRTIDLGDYEYLPRLQFSNRSDALVIQSMNRKQDDLKFHLIDLSNGKTTASIIREEENPKYIEIEDAIYFLPNEDAFLTLSDEDGYKHIYKVSLEGKSQVLTKGNFDVKEIKGLTKNNQILFTAAYFTPINTSIHLIDLNGKHFKTISTNFNADKSWDVNAYTSGNTYFYGSFQDANTPMNIAFFDLNCEVIYEQENNQKIKDILAGYSISKKEFIKVKGATDSLNAWIIKPANFDPNKKYPVYFFVYGGPGANTVNNTFDGPNYAYHQLLAQRGYFVISVDPRGTLYRGAAFKKQTYGQLGNLELEDFEAVAHEISKWKYIDSNRIGIQGWSFGGFMASLAITKGADVFKTAIAVAPVTNWKFYDNVYTERYMNLMENNKDGYAKNSPIYYAKQLKGSFLLIHGDADDNVHIQNSMEFVNKLTELNKDFQFFVYPNKNHSLPGVRKHLYNKMLKFTLEHL